MPLYANLHDSHGLVAASGSGCVCGLYEEFMWGIRHWPFNRMSTSLKQVVGARDICSLNPGGKKEAAHNFKIWVELQDWHV